MNKVNIEDIKNAIASSNSKEDTYRYIISVIDPIIKSYNGKKITKRLESAIKKVLPEFTIYLGTNDPYSIYLKIWGNGIEYNNQFTMYFGWKKNAECFNYGEFVKQNQYYYTTIQESKTIPEDLCELVYEWNELSDKLETLKKKIPSEYTISQFFK